VTERAVRKLLRKWQKRLVLQEWGIRLHAVDEENLSPEGICGHLDWYTESMVADLHVATARPREAVELTVVHELLHLWHVPGYVVWNQVIGELVPQARALAKNLYEEAEERAVIAVALALTRG
jgi:hypothetical protein